VFVFFSFISALLAVSDGLLYLLFRYVLISILSWYVLSCPYEMPTPDSQNPLAGPHMQHRGHHPNSVVLRPNLRPTNYQQKDKTVTRSGVV